jgi:hypothetical protein
MPGTNQTAARQRKQAEQAIAKMVKSGKVASVRIAVSAEQAEAMRDIERWEEFSRRPEANLKLLGRY